MAWRISLLARTEGRGGNEHVWTETPGILRSALQPGIQRLSDVGLTSAVALNIYSLRPPGSSALAHHGPVLSPPLPPPCLQSWCIWGGGEGWKFVFFYAVFGSIHPALQKHEMLWNLCCLQGCSSTYPLLKTAIYHARLVFSSLEVGKSGVAFKIIVKGWPWWSIG